jgi:molybdopterin converting factor small subunit
MPRVFIPSLMRDLTHGQELVSVPGGDVRQVIEGLEQAFPGIQARLCEGDSLRPGLVLVIDSEVSRLGLRHPLEAGSEVHFIPQVAGG